MPTTASTRTGNSAAHHYQLVMRNVESRKRTCNSAHSLISKADCRKLTSYGVAARYPDDLFEPGEADARELSAARRLRTRILALLPKP